MRRRWFVMMIVLFAATALWSVAQQADVEFAPQRRRLVELRKHPDQLDRLRGNLKSYLDLPENRRAAITKLDQDLHELPAKKQERLFRTLERYADWLEQLRAKDPQAYQAIKDAPDAAARLALIKDRRDREWMSQQPKAQRDEWDLQQGGARAEFLAKLRADERTRREQWLIGKRFWRELESKQPLPHRLTDFSPKVRDYVTDYLLPYLTDAEMKQLKEADGKWPDYPQALVEIASKRPSALPPEWPEKFGHLPEPVRHRLVETKKVVDSKKVVTAKKLENLVRQYEGPNFASNVVKHFGQRLPTDIEYLPANYNRLQTPMQIFVKKLLEKTLDPAERRKLIDAENKWPEYPLTIQELSRKYDLTPPWHILPEPDRWKWDLYRNSKGRSWGSEIAKEKKKT